LLAALPAVAVGVNLLEPVNGPGALVRRAVVDMFRLKAAVPLFCVFRVVLLIAFCHSFLLSPARFRAESTFLVCARGKKRCEKFRKKKNGAPAHKKTALV
jgi:hypothetical protein